jgi:hypothetical protein
VTRGSVGRLLGAISGVLARWWPSMFAFQTIVVCRPRPGVRQLLRASEQHNVVSPALRAVLGGDGPRRREPAARDV